MDDQSPADNHLGTIGRVIFGVFGAVFAAIGVTVIGAMWLAPFNDFHSPPLFFRIVASLIAVVFVVMGGGIAVAAWTGKMQPRVSARSNPPPGSIGYTCPQCGATLAKDADVSPMGDVKCTFCQRWFNIHRPASV
ncbi:MAG TPA: hypothetical protein VFG20_08465 [Planctomycetaceae bacterium]|nr:hypothetical protein [Planctomycetaceae bacterium]